MHKKKFYFNFYGRCPAGHGCPNVKISVYHCVTNFVTHCVCHVTSIVGLWLVENIIVIEVKVDELHEGKILSRPSTSMTISAVAQENKKINERLSWAVPHSEINQTKNCPLLQYNMGPIMRQGGQMLQQVNKGYNKRLNWAVPHSEPNQKQKKLTPWIYIQRPYMSLHAIFYHGIVRWKVLINLIFPLIDGN